MTSTENRFRHIGQPTSNPIRICRIETVDDVHPGFRSIYQQGVKSQKSILFALSMTDGVFLQHSKFPLLQVFCGIYHTSRIVPS